MRTERLIDGDGAPTRVLEDDRAGATLFVGSTTEPGPGAALPASGPDLLRLPFAEDGMFIVDAESGTVLEALTSVGRDSGSRVNGDAVHNTYSPGRAETRDSAVRDIAPYTRPLQQARSRVQELTTAKGRRDEFLAMLRHELRNPLAAIQNAVRFLSSERGETDARHRLQALIERQVRRMTQTVNDLLDDGCLHLQRERIDLRIVVSNAIEMLASDINERYHQLTTELPDAPVWLQADPWRLEQVFANLLANASRYTDAGGELAVWVHSRDRQAVVGIRDSGVGIAPEALPHVFDLFRDTDEEAPRSKSGLGIPLALVRSLVELHGGSVTAASAGLKQGSEFTVRLPSEAVRTTSRCAGR
jgi:signal transduction histidine kinase